jgi:hypothetical protein
MRLTQGVFEVCDGGADGKTKQHTKIAVATGAVFTSAQRS